jgi:hypothetical protein
MRWSLVDGIRSQEATDNIGIDEDEKGLWKCISTYRVVRFGIRAAGHR